MKRKSIADYTIEVLKETDNPGVMWGDVTLLDMISKRCMHSKISERGKGAIHPLDRHKRILDALDRDVRFEKYYLKVPFLCRSFKLKEVDKIAYVSTQKMNRVD